MSHIELSDTMLDLTRFAEKIGMNLGHLSNWHLAGDLPAPDATTVCDKRNRDWWHISTVEAWVLERTTVYGTEVA